jgi:hypothetical protein
MFPILSSSVNRSMILIFVPHPVERFAEASWLHNIISLKAERQADKSPN